MKTKKNTASKIPDILVVLICLIGIVISLWMFWKDLNAVMTKSEDPIGEIVFKHRTAQRRFSDGVVWDRLQQRSLIYDGDTIRTADLSRATITFAGGADSIDISDNSIIQIWLDADGNAMVNLAGGSVNIDKRDSSGSFTLVSGGREISVAGGSRVSIQTDAERGDTSLTVMEGSASINSAEGSMIIDSGSALRVGADGSTESFVSIVDISAYPDSYSLDPSPNNIPVRFTWNSVDTAEDEFVRLELSRDRRFSVISQSVDAAQSIDAAQSVDAADGNNATVTLDSAGTYYWRIYLSDGGDDAERTARASTGKFDAAYSETPRLTAPAEGFIYSYRIKKPDVRMYWEDGNEDAWYQVELADNPEMNNPEAVLTAESFFVYSNLTDGNWYWRVTPVYPNGFLANISPSQIGHFTIQQGGELKAPELLTPVPEATLDIAEERSSSHFSWKRDPEAASYTIQISSSPNLENPVISNETADNFYVYTADQNILHEGQYYWAVFQTDSEGNVSSSSETRPFFAAEEKVEYAVIFPPDNYAVADKRLRDVAFTWESSLSIPNRFQIAASNDFSNPLIDEVTNGSNYQAGEIPAGDYYWRIITNENVGEAPIATAPRRIRIAPPLAAPEIVSPAPEESVVLNPGATFRFSWVPVEEADYYQFRLYRGEEQIFENRSLEAPSQSYAMNNLQEGEYNWTVQAFTAEDSAIPRDGIIASSTMTVRELPRVQLEYPARGRSYEGLAALNTPDSLRWSSVEPLDSSRFILSTNPNPLANPRSIIADTQNPETTIPLPSLREGTYYWTIIAYSHEVDISAEVSSFRVLPIPPLPAVSAVYPQNSAVLGFEELTAMNGINFEWRPVNGANRYVFSLYRRDASGTLTPIVENQYHTDTVYPLENVSVLETGTFVWRIEAQTRNNSGNIDQRGNSAEFSFMIDLPPFPAPRAVNPLPNTALTIRLGTNMEFSWEEVEGADYYQFRLFRGGIEIFENQSLETTSVSYPMTDLEPGEYRWTAAAFTSEDSAIQRDGLAASYYFTAEEMGRLILDYPAIGYRYEGLRALNNPDSVRWYSVEETSSSRFILSTNPNPLADTLSIIAEVQNPGNTIRLPPLREGVYYWTVIASTREGVDISAERPSSFTVLPIPPLPASSALLPRHNDVLGIEELGRTMGINFEWQPVDGANQYVFSFYQRDASGALTPIIVNQVQSGTFYAFRNLPVLDTGNYVWRIEAQNRGGSGSVDQRGNSAEFSFMIDLPEIGTIETRDPGILYGN